MPTVGAIVKAILFECGSSILRVKNLVWGNWKIYLPLAAFYHILTDTFTLTWMISLEIRKQNQPQTFDRGETLPPPRCWGIPGGPYCGLTTRKCSKWRRVISFELYRIVCRCFLFLTRSQRVSKHGVFFFYSYEEKRLGKRFANISFTVTETYRDLR